MLKEERICLESKVKTVATALALDIAWEGKPYTPVKDKPYLAPVLIKTPNPNYSTIGSDKWIREHNILQVNIYVSDDQGINPAGDIAERLQAQFKGAEAILTGQISFEPPPYFRSLGSRNGFVIAILSIPYQFDYPEQ